MKCCRSDFFRLLPKLLGCCKTIKRAKATCPTDHEGHFTKDTKGYRPSQNQPRIDHYDFQNLRQGICCSAKLASTKANHPRILEIYPMLPTCYYCVMWLKPIKVWVCVNAYCNKIYSALDSHK